MSEETTADLVERLLYTHEHGLFDANVAGMLASPKEAAETITSQAAEIESLREALRNIMDQSGDDEGECEPCWTVFETARQALTKEPS